MAITVPDAIGLPKVESADTNLYRVTGEGSEHVHTDAVYNALINAAGIMEDRLKD